MAQKAPASSIMVGRRRRRKTNSDSTLSKEKISDDMKPLDTALPVRQQLDLSHEVAVVLVNLFTLDAADEYAFLAA